MSDLVVRLVSLNIWDLPIPLPRLERRERRARLLEGLRPLDADLVLLQESFRPGFRRVIARELAHFHPFPRFAERRWAGILPMDRSGGLFTLSRWPIAEARYQPARQVRSWKIDERIGGKGCLWTRVDTPAGRLLMGNVHFYAGNAPLDAHVRAIQTRHLLLHGELQPGVQTILAGDFNWDRDFERSESGPSGMDLMAEAGFREAADSRSAGLETMDPRHNRYARYVPWHRPPRRLTHVYYRGGLTAGPAPPTLCLHDPPASDHYGLLTTLTIPVP